MEIGNLKCLTNQAMVGATGGWVNPEQERPVLEGIKEVAGYVEKMTGAHNGLIDVQVSGEKDNAAKKLKAMSEQADLIDTRHDNFIRGINAILEGTILLTEDGKTAESMRGVQNRIFPEGLSAVNRTYLEEAGEIEMAKGRLNEEAFGLLRSVPILNGNLKDAVKEWFATGSKLGNLERERKQAAQQANSADTVTRSDVVKARNQWIRVVRAILTGLELVDDLDDETATRLYQPLKDAADKADRGSGAGDQPAEPTAPA